MGVVVVSFVAHFWRLDVRPLHHDESIDAWFSSLVKDYGVARYDPVYHGPLRFYLEATVFNVFGDGVGQARYLAAAAGVAASGIIAASTSLLGRVGAPAAGLAFTISPTILTATRTGREDSLVALVSLGMILLVAHALLAPRPVHLVGLGVLLACSFGIKETTFIFGLGALCFFVGGLIDAWRRPTGAPRAALDRLVALGQESYLVALSAFVVVFAIIFTSGFRYLDGFASGIVDGITYWWSQHEVNRGSQPWFFYGVVYAAYEWLLVAATGIGAVVAWRRRSIVGAWFGWMAASQFVAYSWAGERFAWLGIHPLVPAVLLAGIGIDALVRRVLAERSPLPAVVTGAAVSAFAVTTLAVAIRPAITHGADPRELLVTVQTSVDVPPIAAWIGDEVNAGRIESIVVDERDSGAWPWVWYLHGLPVTYATLDPDAPLPDADVVIVSAAGAVPDAQGARVERFRLRVWWLPDYDTMGVGDAWRWLTRRETWNDPGSTDQYLIVR